MSNGIPEIITPVDSPRQFSSPQLGLALAEVDRLIRSSEGRNVFGVDGSGTTVAVLDTGLNTDHVDFAGRIASQRNFTSDNGSNPNDATDGNGHGTNVAGIIVADADHRGVAPGARVLPLKVLANSGGGSFEAVADALQWVLDHCEEHRITAVCMSLGAGDNRTTDEDLQGEALGERIAQLRAARVPVVIAAGNAFFTHDSTEGMAFPAIYRSCVSVGAVYDEFEGSFTYSSGARAFATAPDRITPFSQRLHETIHSECRTDIFAPGALITSSGIDGPRGESIQQGTSQAAPVAAGVLLLMQTLFLKLTNELPEVDLLVRLLRQSAITINDGDDENDNVRHTGKDFLRVDAFAALDAVGRYVQRLLLETGEPIKA